MATKKSATTAKKPAKKHASSAAAKTTTKVTTVKAAAKPAAPTRASRLGGSFKFSRSPLLAASVAEFVGTFLLAAALLASSGSALVVFFAVIAIALAVGAVSGAHLNPVITAGAWATRRINSVRALSFVIAQVLGAMLALVVVNAYVSAAPDVSQQAALYGQQAPTIFKIGELVSGKEWLVLGAELLGAAIFAFGYAAVSRERGRAAFGLGVGGAIFIALAISGYLVSLIGMNGSVLNPAAAASLQALSWSWWSIFVYIVAPIVGGVLGFGLRDLLDKESV